MCIIVGGCGVVSFSPPSDTLPVAEAGPDFQEAQQLFDYGQFQEAIALWERIPPSDSHYLDAQLGIRAARLYMQEMAQEQAEEVQLSSRIEDMLSEAETLEQQGEFAEALIKYEEAQRLDPKNPRLFNKIEEIHTMLDDSLERHRSLGEMYFAQAEYEKSKSEWEQLLLLDAKNEQAQQRLADIEVLTATSDTVFYQRGKRLFDQGQINAAAAEFEKARQVNPTNTRTLDYLHQLQEFSFTEYIVKKGDTLSSIAQKYTGNPSDYTILVDFNNIGENVPLKVGQLIKIPHVLGFKKALNPEANNFLLEQPVAETEEQPPATSREISPVADEEQLEHVFNQGVDAFQEGDYREAVQYFQEVYQRNPEHQEAYNYFTRAIAQMRQGDSSEVIEEIIPVSTEEMDSLQTDIQPMIDKGIAYLEAGEFQSAITVFEQTSQRAPDNSRVYQYLEDARDGLKKLITSYLNEGIKLFNQEALEDAILVWNKVLELDPVNQQALDYKARAETILKAFAP